MRSFTKGLALITLAAMLLSIFPCPAGAATPIRVYNKSGTLVGTFDKMDKAVAALGDGYTIELPEGEHTVVSGAVGIGYKNVTIKGVGRVENIVCKFNICNWNEDLDRTAHNLTIEGITFFGTWPDQRSDLILDGGYGYTVRRCVFLNSYLFVQGRGTHSITVTECRFGEKGKAWGRISIGPEVGGGIQINRNEFYSSTVTLSGISLEKCLEVDATLNYWGTRSGPILPSFFQADYTVIDGDANLFIGTEPATWQETQKVRLQPWLDKPPAKDPKPVFAIKNQTRDKFYWNFANALDKNGDFQEGDTILFGPFTFTGNFAPKAYGYVNSVEMPSVTLQGTDAKESKLVGGIVLGGTHTEDLAVTLKDFTRDGAGGIYAYANSLGRVSVRIENITFENVNDCAAVFAVSKDDDDKPLEITVTNSRLATGNYIDIYDGSLSLPVPALYAAAVAAQGKNTRVAVTHNRIKQAGRDKLLLDPQELYVAVALGGGARLTDFTGNTFVGANEVERIYGNNRFETAIKISESWYHADRVLLARADSFTDALAGVIYAGQQNLPILLTNASALPAAVLKHLGPLGLNASSVTILGGPGAVSGEVAGALAAAGFHVDRLGGGDRFETAVKIAEQVNITGPGRTAFIVRADEFADALAAGPLAYQMGAPILPVERERIPEAVRKFIEEAFITNFIIVGGESAVSNKVAELLLEMDGTADVVRIHGSNRYETARALVEYGMAKGYFRVHSVEGIVPPVFLARGDDYADALAGGALACKEGGVIMLTAPTSLSKPTRELLESDWLGARVTILGGPGAISEAVAQAVAALSFRRVVVLGEITD